VPDQCSAAATKKTADRRAGAPASKTAVSFTGELVGASEDEITLAAEEGIIAIPYSEIRRSNLVEE
jgi:ribosome maturation factor RimP